MENIILQIIVGIIIAIIMLAIGWVLGSRSLIDSMNRVNPELLNQMKVEMVAYLKRLLDEPLEKAKSTELQ